jgi:hypothetical protein
MRALLYGSAPDEGAELARDFPSFGIIRQLAIEI